MIQTKGMQKISLFWNCYESVHDDHKGKDILTLVQGPRQGLDDTTLTAETKYPINFLQSGQRFV